MYADDFYSGNNIEQQIKTNDKNKSKKRDRRNKQRKWKIRTSDKKFKMILSAQLKIQKLKVNGKEIETSKTGKLFRVKNLHNRFCEPYH